MIGFLIAKWDAASERARVFETALQISVGVIDVEKKFILQAHQEIDELKLQVLEVKMRERVRKINPKAPATRIVKAVLTSSKNHNIDPRMVLMQIEQESSYDVLAIGDFGASRGLMQIGRAAAKEVGLNWNNDWLDVEKNIEAGIAYLALQRTRSKNIYEALWNYNGGGDPFYLERIQYRISSAKL